MNTFIFPEANTGDIAWLQNYEFQFNGSEWEATGNNIPQDEEETFVPPIPPEANTA